VGLRDVNVEVSNGFKVPDVEGMKMNEAIVALNDAGFNNVKTVAGNIADRENKSLVVYQVVYEDPDTNDWAAIPSDGRLSSQDSILVYYYGEFSDENTTDAESTTQSQTTATNGAQSTPEHQGGAGDSEAPVD
jgi:hypothetical protein